MTLPQVMSRVMLRSFEPFNEPIYVQHILKEGNLCVVIHFVCTRVDNMQRNLPIFTVGPTGNTKPVQATE